MHFFTLCLARLAWSVSPSQARTRERLSRRIRATRIFKESRHGSNASPGDGNPRYAHPGLRRHPQPRRAGLRRQAAPPLRTAPPRADGRPRRAPERAGRGQAAGLPAGYRRHPRRRLEDLAAAGRPAGPPRGNHRPGESQDDDQRAQFRRQEFHGGFRGLQLPELGQPDQRSDQCPRRLPQNHLLRQPGRQAIPAQRRHRHPAAARAAGI